MNALTATIAIFFSIAPAIGGGAKHSNRADKVIADLSSATRSVTSVRGSVEITAYDETFRRISYGHGKFAYFQPRDGFWQVSNTADLSKQARRGEKVGRHRVEDYPAEHFQWHGNYGRDVNDAKKEYSEIPVVDGKGWFFELLFSWTRAVDAATPFLPGLPNKSTVDKWTFEISDESATHIWLHATPKTDADKKWFAACELYLQKQPISVEAVQYTYPGGKQRRVLLFSNVETNPASQEKPDLSGYKCASREKSTATK